MLKIKIDIINNFIFNEDLDILRNDQYKLFDCYTIFGEEVFLLFFLKII